MRLVIQRVSEASVTVDGECISSIDRGLLVLVGVENGDTEQDASWLAAKTAALRIFDDEEGVMNRSVIDVDGGLLAVSQFTCWPPTAMCRRCVTRWRSSSGATWGTGDRAHAWLN